MDRSRKGAVNRRNRDGTVISCRRLPDGNRQRWRGDNHSCDGAMIGAVKKCTRGAKAKSPRAQAMRRDDS
jgi:hypothetical protein